MYDFIKRFISDDVTFYGLLLLLVGLTSFGLGRWSMVDIKTGQQRASIVYSEVYSGVETAADEDAFASSPAAAQTSTGKYVASKNGSKYHLPWCPGAQQMKEENKVWFSSKEEAEAAGYTPAGNCKGL